MLADFEDNGYLPPGIHYGTLDEVVSRFGQGSPERDVETAELKEFVAWARQAGIERVLLAGSYVTDNQAPNDVDVIVLPGKTYTESGTVSERASGWPFLHIMVAADEGDLEEWAKVDLGTDRDGVPRGLVEIQL